MSWWLAATIWAKATSSPAIARSIVAPVAWVSMVTLLASMTYRCHCPVARYKLRDSGGGGGRLLDAEAADYPASWMTSGGQIQAQQWRSTFRRECSVAVDVRAPAQKVWSILTDADDMTRWNSTLTSVEGPIELGSTVKMRVPEAPDRTFKPRVTRFEPNREMEWREGNSVMFLGVRTYSLMPSDGGRVTTLRMTEVFSGLMLPIIGSRLPDFAPIFERYAADLKHEAEGASRSRSDSGSPGP